MDKDVYSAQAVICKILQSTMDKDVYSAQAICKPNATFKDVVNDIANLTRDFTEHDFVIIQAGSNDVLKGELVKNDFMEHVFMELGETNVIFLNMQNEAWLDVYTHTDTNSKYNSFHNIFTYYFEKHFPLKKVKEVNETKIDWIDRYVANLTESLSDLHRLSKATSDRTNLTESLSDLHRLSKATSDRRICEYYKVRKREIQILINNHKKSYNDSKILNSSNMSKTIWNIINSSKILNSSNMSKTIWNIVNRDILGKNISKDTKVILKKNGVDIQDPFELCRMFNDQNISKDTKVILKKNGVDIQDPFELCLKAESCAEVAGVGLLTTPLKAESCAEVAGVGSSVFEKMMEWCHINSLKLNIEKTRVVAFTARNEYTVEMKAGTSAIEQTNNIRFLGLTLDYKLKWEFQIDNLRSESNNENRGLYKRNVDVSNSMATRNASMLSIPQHKLALYERGAFDKSIVAYNALRSKIRSISNSNGFRKAVYEFLVSGAFYGFNEYLAAERPLH
ncbi:hypothetical protein QE152_g18152 [Popillia japonica]|uniref:Uncharacterized protein n=1 Tax=Popillia japonica TaxID=7064 RepID=A0AAW1L008_POPJA